MSLLAPRPLQEEEGEMAVFAVYHSLVISYDRIMT